MISDVGKMFLPASPEDVAAYLEDRWDTGARASTLRVVAVAIARNHKDAGFDVPVHHYVARSVLDELTLGDSPEPSTATSPSGRRRTSRVGDGAVGWSAPRAPAGGARIDDAMIGLMRDARFRVREAAELPGVMSSGCAAAPVACVVGAEETDYREVSADTMKRLWAIRRGAGGDELVLGMRPNQIAMRIGSGARQAGLGESYWGGQPPAGHDPGHGDSRRAAAGQLRRRERKVKSRTAQDRRESLAAATCDQPIPISNGGS